MSSSEWREVKVSEIGKIVTGKTPKTAISENYGGNIPFLTPSDDMNIKKVKSTARTLSEMGLNSVKNCLLPAKSICVSCIGSDLGKVILTSEPTVTNQQINSIVPDEKFDPDFIYYGMTILGKHLNYLSKTSTAVPIINKTTFSNFSILVPPTKEQKAIAHILSTLDDKIEVNNQINKTLENIAQAIFKQWFVDFEFPNEDGEPYKSSGGEMVESELGMIPKGWEVKKLGYVLETLEAGNRPKGGAGNLMEGIPSIGAENIIGLGKYDYSKEKYVTEEYFAKMNKGKVNPGDVLLYKDGAQIGRKTMFMNGFPHKKCCINSHVFILRTNDMMTQSYLYFWLDQELVTQSIINLNANSAQPGINQSKVKTLKILVPEFENIEMFDVISKSLLNKLFENCNENNILQKTRNALLPKLMSGEIRVPLNEEGDAS